MLNDEQVESLFDTELQRLRAQFYDSLTKTYGANITQLQINDFLITELAYRRLEIRGLLRLVDRMVELLDLDLTKEKEPST